MHSCVRVIENKVIAQHASALDSQGQAVLKLFSQKINTFIFSIFQWEPWLPLTAGVMFSLKKE